MSEIVAAEHPSSQSVDTTLPLLSHLTRTRYLTVIALLLALLLGALLIGLVLGPSRLPVAAVLAQGVKEHMRVIRERVGREEYQEAPRNRGA